MTQPDQSQKLKLALAKMLPEQLTQAENGVRWLYDSGIVRRNYISDKFLYVYDTEWLYVCWLIEDSLTPAERIQYAELLADETTVVDWGYYPGESAIDWDGVATIATATWERRAKTLCRMKGITP